MLWDKGCKGQEAEFWIKSLAQLICIAAEIEEIDDFAQDVHVHAADLSTVHMFEFVLVFEVQQAHGTTSNIIDPETQSFPKQSNHTQEQSDHCKFFKLQLLTSSACHHQLWMVHKKFLSAT